MSKIRLVTTDSVHFLEIGYKQINITSPIEVEGGRALEPGTRELLFLIDENGREYFAICHPEDIFCVLTGLKQCVRVFKEENKLSRKEYRSLKVQMYNQLNEDLINNVRSMMKSGYDGEQIVRTKD